MDNILSRRFYEVAGRGKVTAATLPSSPVSIKFQVQHPILIDFQIAYSPITVLPNNVGFRVLVDGRIVFPDMGSSEDSNFNTSPLWSPMVNNNVLDSKELNIPISGGAPYIVEFQFYNADAADYFYQIFMRVAPKIKLPNASIESDKLEMKQGPIE